MGCMRRLEVIGPNEQCCRKLGETRFGKGTMRGKMVHRTCKERLGQ